MWPWGPNPAFVISHSPLRRRFPFSLQPGEWVDAAGTYRHWSPKPINWRWHFSLRELTSRNTGQSCRIEGPWQGWKEWGAPSYSPGFLGHNGMYTPTDHSDQLTDHWCTAEIHRALTKWLDYTKLSRHWEINQSWLVCDFPTDESVRVTLSK